jgi:hypothetical protein
MKQNSFITVDFHHKLHKLLSDVYYGLIYTSSTSSSLLFSHKSIIGKISMGERKRERRRKKK